MRADHARSGIVDVSGSGQWCTHRAVPRNHRCCHWRPRLALSPSHRQFWIFHFSEFSTSCPKSHLVVMLYQFIITFPVAILCTLLHRDNTSFEVWYLHPSRRLQWTAVSCKRSICNKVNELGKSCPEDLFPNTCITSHPVLTVLW